MRDVADFDVLVVGAGLAGVSAALAAAASGARVALACEGTLFGGSSFYGGTWGLGLVGPRNRFDVDDLSRTVKEIGCGVCDDSLVDSFIAAIPDAIAALEDQGIRPLVPQHPDQRAYIPCFDHSVRLWRGVTHDSFRSTWGDLIVVRGVTVVEHVSLQGLLVDGAAVVGAVLRSAHGAERIFASATVLATGGYAGLFEHHLGPATEMGVGQASALQAGARLVNMEFMQIMLAYGHPAAGIVFNEKLYRHTRFIDQAGNDILADRNISLQLLAQRGEHGPYSCRLADGAIDRALAEAMRSGQPVYARLQPDCLVGPPEFVATYMKWLEGKGIDDPTRPMRVNLCAHAANGGIAIDSEGFTGVEGLYAAGECTGGMHGADRIGGLASASAVVFGPRAGTSAAAWARHVPYVGNPDEAKVACGTGGTHDAPLMDDVALCVREEDRLRYAYDRATSPAERVVLFSMMMRRESRGSHYRSDAPRQDARFASAQYVSLGSDGMFVSSFDGIR